MSSNYSYAEVTFICLCLQTQTVTEKRRFLTHLFLPFMQFFFFLLIIFAIEVAAGIWGFSNQTKVTKTRAFLKDGSRNKQNTRHNGGFWGSVTSELRLCLQVVNDITSFYKQTYITYQTNKDPRLKETLLVIQTGVRRRLTLDEPGVWMKRHLPCAF